MSFVGEPGRSWNFYRNYTIYNIDAIIKYCIFSIYVVYNVIMNKYIISNPEILGGKPVIKGTRIPVDQILFLLNDNYPVEAIHELYPHVSVETIKGTIEEAAQIVNIHASQIS